MVEISLKSSDLLYLSASINEVSSAYATIIIVPGLNEYKERYFEMIDYFVNNKFNIVIYDPRGQGKSVNNENTLGFISDAQKLIDDFKNVVKYTEKRFPNISIYVVADSLGTLPVINYLPDNESIKKIVFACDVGMGSSAMGARNFINKIKGFKLDIEVINSSISNIPSDSDIIITHKGLLGGIKKDINKSKIICIENFLEDDTLELLYEKFKKECNSNVDNTYHIQSNELLNEKNILLNLENESKEEAIIRAGNLLFNNGYVGYEYINSMLEREKRISTYIGYGVAMPHGTEFGKEQVKRAGIVVLQYPEGINFGGQKAYLLIAIAAKGEEHLEILSNIAQALGDVEAIENLKTTKNSKDVLKVFNL